MTKAQMPLFYKSVVGLDRNVHARLRLRPVDNFVFAADSAVIPLLTAEFAPVAREYPIVFLTDKETKDIVPVALTGMPQGKNVFLDANGLWNARYVPAYVRRYPFVFVETSPEQYAVGIDPAAPFLSETVGTPLFEANGEPTPTLQETIQRLGEYQRVANLTKAFLLRLDAAKLLVEANAKADLPDGRSMEWRGFSMIDEAKFRELPEAILKEWFRSGELGLIYAHLLSLGNLSEVLRRHTNDAGVRVKSL